MARGCIFCGGTPRTLTHLVRKAWTDKKLMPGPGSMVGYFGVEPDQKKWESRGSTAAAGKLACAACNSTWMDEIDRAAEPLVEPFAFGMPGTLRKLADQLTVARWLTQVALLADANGKSVLPESLAEVFFKDRNPVPDSAIWLSRVVSSRMEVTLWTGGWADPPGSPPHTFFNQLRIGDFISRMYIPLAEAPEGFDFRTPAPDPSHRPFFRKLWPPTLMPVSWPPDSAIGEPQLHEFARRA